MMVAVADDAAKFLREALKSEFEQSVRSVLSRVRITATVSPDRYEPSFVIDLAPEVPSGTN